jgi:hypothetical protein
MTTCRRRTSSVVERDEGDRVAPLVERLDFEADGTVHHRIWSLDDAERTLMLDVPHEKLDPKKG